MKHGILLSILSLSILQVGCSKPRSAVYNKQGQPIVSDQFDPNEVTFSGKPLFISLLQLNTPALLTNAKKDGQGKWVIDAQLKEQLLQEQQSIEDQLKKISSEIKIVYRYRLVLNALAVEAPQEFAEAVNGLDVNLVEADERFRLPEIQKPLSARTKAFKSKGLSSATSLSFIGADEVHNKLRVKNSFGQMVPVRGQGMRIGVIDSGIDYTHAMFGGPGNPDVYKSIDPTVETPFFPTSKVVGGMDFVGAKFNTGSHIYDQKVPFPDPNPLDHGGHGTHVSGTIAGRGDGVNTYDGGAPDAELYALKVFGDGEGSSTSDTSVIAALEYAVDPNQDLDPSDRLDVVNLSLGSGYGKPHSLYNLAISNVAQAGTFVAVSAGNDGATVGIVGSPGTADEALTVAASIDGMDKNWHFPASEFRSATHPKIVVQAIEGATTKPIAESPVQGKLVYIGKAIADLTMDQLAALSGNVALIDRGMVSFDDKIKRAIGATGIVMINSDDSDPFTMGGNATFAIPGIMISKAVGQMIKDDLAKGEVTVIFNSSELVAKPELVDTIVSFSSQGPRSIDGLIKPEITAPGYSITSAAMGSGNEGVEFSGTSMSSPHIAGVAALLRQYRPELSVREVKSLLMNTAEVIDDAKGVIYPVSRQGAGRVNVYRAATASVMFSEPSLSLGEVQVDTTQTFVKKIMVTNDSSQAVNYSFAMKQGSEMKVSIAPNSISLNPGEKKEIEVTTTVNATNETSMELNSFVQIRKNSRLVGSLPILAVVNQLTKVSASNLVVKSSGAVGSAGADVGVSLGNAGVIEGDAYLFNLLGKDDRKPKSTNSALSSDCDLESVGYNLVDRGGALVLQVAIKIFNPVSSWNVCDIDVEFDTNADQTSDKEIIGTEMKSLPGFAEVAPPGFASVFVDSVILNQLYSDYLQELALQKPEGPNLDFKPSFISNSPMQVFDHSTLAIVEVPVADLGLPEGSEIQTRVTVTYNDRNVIEGNDVLNGPTGVWHKLSLRPSASGFSDLPEKVTLSPGSTAQFNFKKGEAAEDLVVYMPRNAFSLLLTTQDEQSVILTPSYGVSVGRP